MNTPTNTYWTTRDNRKLLIADMDIDHVHHCVGMLTRQFGHRSNHYNYCPRVRLCQLVTALEQDAVLAALTNPNS